MSFKYELLKTLVRLIGFKNKSFAGGAEAIIARAKARNAKNPIPELRDAEINVERIIIDGCPVLVMTHKVGKWLIGTVGFAVISAALAGIMALILKE